VRERSDTVLKGTALLQKLQGGQSSRLGERVESGQVCSGWRWTARNNDAPSGSQTVQKCTARLLGLNTDTDVSVSVSANTESGACPCPSNKKIGMSVSVRSVPLCVT
jgi:hypothetical protein